MNNTIKSAGLSAMLALSAWIPRRYDGTVILVKAAEQPGADPSTLWEPHCDKLQVRKTAGTHRTLFTIHLQATAQIIAGRLGTK